MKYSKRLWMSIAWIILGTVLTVCAFTNVLDEFWRGMGIALLIVGGLQLIRQIKYQTNQDYKENVDVEVNDERNKYLSTKAWSWAGYLFVLIAALATVAFKIFGLEQYMMIASGSMCIILVLYWLSFAILRKKY